MWADLDYNTSRIKAGNTDDERGGEVTTKTNSGGGGANSAGTWWVFEEAVSPIATIWTAELSLRMQAPTQHEPGDG